MDGMDTVQVGGDGGGATDVVEPRLSPEGDAGVDVGDGEAGGEASPSPAPSPVDEAAPSSVPLKEPPTRKEPRRRRTVKRPSYVEQFEDEDEV